MFKSYENTTLTLSLVDINISLVGKRIDKHTCQILRSPNTDITDLFHLSMCMSRNADSCLCFIRICIVNVYSVLSVYWV